MRTALWMALSVFLLTATNGHAERVRRPILTPERFYREGLASARIQRQAPRKLDLRGLSAKDADRLFWQGCHHYWQGEYDEALANLEAATELNEEDARYWYYRALSESALGLPNQAESSLRQGAEMQLRGLPNAEQISLSLERVQGEPRRMIREAIEARRPR